MRKIAFFVGLFALVVGWLTYDSTVSTSMVPIVTGGLVVVLAVFDLIPEFTVCPSCGKKNLKKKKFCIHCGQKLDK